jgi:hypothetical protein
MTYTILHKDLQRLNVVEHHPHHFTAEASELGFPAGMFPEEIKTDMGNGQAFILDQEKVDDGDLLWVRYRQALGCVSLTIFND